MAEKTEFPEDSHPSKRPHLEQVAISENSRNDDPSFEAEIRSIFSSSTAPDRGNFVINSMNYLLKCKSLFHFLLKKI